MKADMCYKLLVKIHVCLLLELVLQPYSKVGYLQQMFDPVWFGVGYIT